MSSAEYADDVIRRYKAAVAREDAATTPADKAAAHAEWRERADEYVALLRFEKSTPTERHRAIVNAAELGHRIETTILTNETLFEQACAEPKATAIIDARARADVVRTRITRSYRADPIGTARNAALVADFERSEATLARTCPGDRPAWYTAARTRTGGQTVLAPALSSIRPATSEHIDSIIGGLQRLRSLAGQAITLAYTAAGAVSQQMLSLLALMTSIGMQLSMAMLRFGATLVHFAAFAVNILMEKTPIVGKYAKYASYFMAAILINGRLASVAPLGTAAALTTMMLYGYQRSNVPLARLFKSPVAALINAATLAAFSEVLFMPAFRHVSAFAYVRLWPEVALNDPKVSALGVWSKLQLSLVTASPWRLYDIMFGNTWARTQAKQLTALHETLLARVPANQWYQSAVSSGFLDDPNGSMLVPTGLGQSLIGADALAAYHQTSHSLALLNDGIARGASDYALFTALSANCGTFGLEFCRNSVPIDFATALSLQVNDNTTQIQKITKAIQASGLSGLGDATTLAAFIAFSTATGGIAVGPAAMASVLAGVFGWTAGTFSAVLSTGATAAAYAKGVSGLVALTSGIFLSLATSPAVSDPSDALNNATQNMMSAWGPLLGNPLFGNATASASSTSGGGGGDDDDEKTL